MNGGVMPGPEASAKHFETLVPKQKFNEKARKELRESVAEFMAKNPGRFNSVLIQNMQRLRMKRPSFIPKIDWELAGKPLGPQDTIVCYMAAWGIEPDEIGRQIGYSVEHIRKIIDSEQGQKKLDEIQLRVFGKDPKKWIEAILPKAIQTAEALMQDRNVKPATRLDAAKYFMDRQMGKPLQKIENDSSTLRQLFEQMDKKARKPDIDVTDALIISDVALIENSEPKDAIDQWCEDNL